MTIRAAWFGGVVALTLLLTVSACELQYPWDAEVPQAQDSVRDLACGAYLDGTIRWHTVDEDDYPSEWTELCQVTWAVEGELTTAVDAGECYHCRCAYEATLTVEQDTCGWYAVGDEAQRRFGFTSTLDGPADQVDEAADWPWLVYTDFTVGWPDEMDLYFRARPDDNALPGEYDAGELYLWTFYYWEVDDGEIMLPQGWLGMWG